MIMELIIMFVLGGILGIVASLGAVKLIFLIIEQKREKNSAQKIHDQNFEFYIRGVDAETSQKVNLKGDMMKQLKKLENEAKK